MDRSYELNDDQSSDKALENAEMMAPSYSCISACGVITVFCLWSIYWIGEIFALVGRER